MRGRCEKKHGKGNCQKQGLICRPKQPNCKKLGLGGQLGLSCAKKVRIGNPKTGICNSRQEEDAGLCYKNCKSGDDGDGPVCWADKPKGWVNCGMGAAKDFKTCASVTFGQVAAVGEMALFIGSLGTSSAATGGAKAATSADTEKVALTVRTGAPPFLWRCLTGAHQLLQQWSDRQKQAVGTFKQNGDGAQLPDPARPGKRRQRCP